MRRTVAVSLLTVALLLVPAALSSVMRHGGGGHGGGHGFHGHNGFHGHFHGNGVIVAGPWRGSWWGRSEGRRVGEGGGWRGPAETEVKEGHMAAVSWEITEDM